MRLRLARCQEAEDEVMAKSKNRRTQIVGFGGPQISVKKKGDDLPDFSSGPKMSVNRGGDMIPDYSNSPKMNIDRNSVEWRPVGAKKRTKNSDKPEIEDPPLPPVDGDDNGDGTGGTGGNTSTSGAVPKVWPAIVDHFFPNGGTGYATGGLVRGGGAAQRGRGRGRIV